MTNLERNGFEMHDVEGWREHYQRTCRHWHDAARELDAAVEEVGEAKTRLWLAYLGGVLDHRSSATRSPHQTLASKRRRGPSGLPPTRADLYS